MKRLLKEFIKEDESEPFINREYVEETKRIYRLLIGDIPHGNETDNAVYDIVNALLYHFEKTRYHLKV